MRCGGVEGKGDDLLGVRSEGYFYLREIIDLKHHVEGFLVCSRVFNIGEVCMKNAVECPLCRVRVHVHVPCSRESLDWV